MEICQENQNSTPEGSNSLENKNISEMERRERIEYILRKAGLSGIVKLR
jgi:hypothetical protein